MGQAFLDLIKLDMYLQSLLGEQYVLVMIEYLYDLSLVDQRILGIVCMELA